MTDNLERRDLVDKADAWDAIAAKNAEITRLQEALAAAEAERDGLLDPATVRVNILHGRIAIPDDLVWLHDTNGPVATLLAETREKALEEAARAAYACPSYVLGALQTDEDGMLLPGSPYDRGRYETYRAIRSLSNEETPK